MTTILFLDDERFPPDRVPAGTHYVTVRTVHEAQQYVRDHGLPDSISFDHDLGADAPGGDAIHFAQWLVDAHLDGEINLSRCAITTHSQNPVGAANILGKFTRLPQSGSAAGMGGLREHSHLMPGERHDPHD